jgi:hypothetical protein
VFWDAPVKYRLAAQRPVARTLPSSEGETSDPYNRQQDGRNPQQVNGESCAEKNDYQESQQDYDHDDRSPFLGIRVEDKIDIR